MPAGLRLLVPAAKLAHKAYKAYKKASKAKKLKRAGKVLAAEEAYANMERKKELSQEHREKVKRYKQLSRRA